MTHILFTSPSGYQLQTCIACQSRAVQLLQLITQPSLRPLTKEQMPFVLSTLEEWGFMVLVAMEGVPAGGSKRLLDTMPAFEKIHVMQKALDEVRTG